MVQIIFLSNFLCDLAVTAKIKQQLSVSLKRVSLAGLFFFVANQWLVLLTFVTVAK